MTGFQVRFAMPSDVRHLPVVRGAVGALTAAIGWGEAECRAILLALDEAIANVISHAYHGRTDGLIELECRESEDGLEITILDRGESRNLSKICAREVGCEEPGGLGTHIIRDVMDSPRESARQGVSVPGVISTLYKRKPGNRISASASYCRDVTHTLPIRRGAVRRFSALPVSAGQCTDQLTVARPAA
jgi:serine/threonine-protein kinase RsbW